MPKKKLKMFYIVGLAPDFEEAERSCRVPTAFLGFLNRKDAEAHAFWHATPEGENVPAKVYEVHIAGIQARLDDTEEEANG